MDNNPLLSALKLISNILSNIAPGHDKIASENGVLVLTQANFREAVSEYDLLLVKFYMPHCPRCRMFGNEYLKVKELLNTQKSKIQLAQVNAQTEKDLIKQYKVAVFPTIKLFKNGNFMDYYGVKQAEHIVAWLNKNCPRC